MKNVQVLGSVYDDDIGAEVRFVHVNRYRRDLLEIREKLCELAEIESTKLYRLARKAKEHGCSLQVIRDLKSEAWELHMTGYPERIISDRYQDDTKYAFKW